MVLDNQVDYGGVDHGGVDHGGVDHGGGPVLRLFIGRKTRNCHAGDGI